MSFLGNVLEFEKFNFGDMLGKLKDDPERAFIGAIDPFSSKVWGTILGKDYTPVVDQFGGAAPDVYDKAQAAGINTGPGRTMHNIARTIASIYGGGAAMSGLGSAASSAGLMGSASGASGGMFGAAPAFASDSAVIGGTGLLGSSAPTFASNPAVIGGTGLFGTTGAPATGLAGAWDKVSAMGKAAQPFMNAAQTGMSVAKAMSPQASPVSPSPMTLPQGASPVLAQLAQPPADPAAEQRAAMMAQRRATMWG